MKNKFKFLALAIMALLSVNVWSADGDVFYTLTCTKNTSNSAYASNYDVTINGLQWNAPGNQTFDGYWRIGGGKATTATARTITGKSKIGSVIGAVKVYHNGVSATQVAIPSVVLSVAKDNAFSNIVETITVSNPSVSSSGNFEISPKSEDWPKDCYYKITINYTKSTTGNGGLNLTKIEFIEGASAAAYSITYNLDGGKHGTNHPTSGTIGTAFAVSPPTKEHYTFTGWQVTSDLNTSTAKWGPGSALLTGTITSSTQKCIISTTSDIYFKDLGANGASVTLTATWEEKAKVTVTLLNNNVPVNAGGFDAQGQKQYYSDETLGTLPTLNSGVACDETSTTFMGWTTEQITTKRDYAPDFVTPSTPVTPNMTLRAVWAKEE